MRKNEMEIWNNIIPAVGLGYVLACLNFWVGIRIRRSSLGSSLDRFFRLGLGWSAVRGALFFFIIVLILRFGMVGQLPFLVSLGAFYFLFLFYEITLLLRAR